MGMDLSTARGKFVSDPVMFDVKDVFSYRFQPRNGSFLEVFLDDNSVIIHQLHKFR